MSLTLTLLTLKSLRRLLRAGVRHVEIAKRLDLSLWTISRVASERRLRRRKLALLTEVELPEDDRPPEYVPNNLRRCPACGGMVYQWPCLTCRLRAAQASGIALPDEVVRDRDLRGGDGESGREGEAPIESQRIPSPPPS